MVNQLIPREKYLDILRQMPIVCVDLIIVNKDRYLIMKRNNPPAKDQWWFCGGRVLKGESLQGAAIRKAKEETGLNVLPRRVVDVNETMFSDGPEGINVHTINVVYLVHAHDSCILLDEQHEEHRWVSVDEIPQELDYRLQDALKLCFDVA